MGLRKAKGNTYPDLDWLWSPLVCGCQHQCTYCYAMKQLQRKKVSWDMSPHWASENYKWAKSDKVWKGFPYLLEGRIFVCDTTDLFADNIPDGWIEAILEHCLCINASFGDIQHNEFIFQTKNPTRYHEFNHIFERFMNGQIRFGITLETNRDISQYSKAPSPKQRADVFGGWIHAMDFPSFVTIEPVMKFDEYALLEMIERINPDIVWIGADSQKCDLPEPSPDELISFILHLKMIVKDVRLKDNLNRLLPKELRTEVTKPQ